MYLLAGSDSAKKEERIEALKKSTLKSNDARQFDYENLSAHKLHKDILKQAFDALPAVGKKRFVLIREVEKLDKHNKDLLLQLANQELDHVVVVLDALKPDFKTSFFKKISALAKTEKFDRGYRENVFDMTKAIGSREPARAIKNSE